MPRTRNPYPAEFREQMVALVRTGRSAESLAREGLRGVKHGHTACRSPKSRRGELCAGALGSSVLREGVIQLADLRKSQGQDVYGVIRRTFLARGCAPLHPAGGPGLRKS